MVTREQVEQFLATLGNTSEEVAASVRKAGVKGWAAWATNCPIARLTNTQFGANPMNNGERAAFCNSSFVILGVSGVPPKAVSDFITDFDERKYLDLLDGDMLSAAPGSL